MALIRLAQARVPIDSIQARLRFSNEINKSDINDALILIEESQKSVTNTRFKDKKSSTDDVSSVFEIVKDLCKYKEDQSVEYSVCLKRVLARGYAQETLDLVLKQY